MVQGAAMGYGRIQTALESKSQKHFRALVESRLKILVPSAWNFATVRP